MSEWQPIETAPKDGKIIVFNKNNRTSIEYGAHIQEMIEAAKEDGDTCFYTHWMPLPPPPTETQNYVIPQMKGMLAMVNALTIRGDKA